jgi:hypothetical protein
MMSDQTVAPRSAALEDPIALIALTQAAPVQLACCPAW